MLKSRLLAGQGHPLALLKSRLLHPHGFLAEAYCFPVFPAGVIVVERPRKAYAALPIRAEVVAQKVQRGPSVAHLPKQAQARGHAGITCLLLPRQLHPLPPIERQFGPGQGGGELHRRLQAGFGQDGLAHQFAELPQQPGPAHRQVAQLLAEADQLGVEAGQVLAGRGAVGAAGSKHLAPLGQIGLQGLAQPRGFIGEQGPEKEAVHLFAHPVQAHLHHLVVHLARQRFHFLLPARGAAVVEGLVGVERQAVLVFGHHRHRKARYVHRHSRDLALVGSLAVQGQLGQAALHGQPMLVVGHLRIVECLLPAQGGVLLRQFVAMRQRQQRPVWRRGLPEYCHSSQPRRYKEYQFFIHVI